MKKRIQIILIIIIVLIILTGCTPISDSSIAPSSQSAQNSSQSIWLGQAGHYPKIASWLAKKDEVIAGNKPYDLVMSGWFTAEEAAKIKAQNPQVILLAGLSVNWVWDNPDWMNFLLTVSGYGKEKPVIFRESMYLHKPDGSRCAFGWASEEWGQEEIWAMDPRNPDWVALITSFYQNVLNQPQHDGIIIDMVTEKSWSPETISDEEWIEATKSIFRQIEKTNTGKKMIVFNAGRDLTEIDEYSDFMDGYLMENFMGTQLKSTFDEGLKAAEDNYLVIYAADTDDTGIQDLSKMRLGLALSLMHDNTYFSYDFGPRNHGQAWWFIEYDVDLGKPLGAYYQQGEAYYREFEKGIVVASPYANTNIILDGDFTDVSTGIVSRTFDVEKGDARIFMKVD